MRIYEINTVCGEGSTGRIAKQISDLLNNDGNTSTVIYGRGKKRDGCREQKVGSILEVLMHVFITRVFDMHGLGSRLATKSLVGQLKKEKPDVIHIHSLTGYYINYPILFDYIKKNNVPVIWTLHDCWAITGHCANFDYVGCDKWKHQCKECQLRKTYPESWGIDRSKKNYLEKRESFSGCKNLTIVTPSNWLARIVSESYLKTYPIKVIHNGIDLSVFHPCDYSVISSKYNLGSKKIILGVASGFDERKGLYDFYKLAEMLDEEYLVVLVGCEHDDDSKDKIKCISQTSDISELAMFYSMAFAFVNMTYEDNFPTVNIEALACGAPVITYNTGGSPEAIDDTCGIVVEKGNVDAIRDAVVELNRNPLKREDSVRRAQNFNKDINFREYIDMIYSIAGRKR